MRCFCYLATPRSSSCGNILYQHVVRSDDVLGAVCGYLLAAGAWSNLFMLTEIFVLGSYSMSQGFATGLDSWHGRTAVLNYVSLGSLTGVGSGAVVPQSWSRSRQQRLGSPRRCRSENMMALSRRPIGVAVNSARVSAPMQANSGHPRRSSTGNGDLRR